MIPEDIPVIHMTPHGHLTVAGRPRFGEWTYPPQGRHVLLPRLYAPGATLVTPKVIVLGNQSRSFMTVLMRDLADITFNLKIN